jgi:signal transduction histidine kinase/CheY-like chemotaxis protein
MNLSLRRRLLLLALLPATLVATLLAIAYLMLSIDSIERGLRVRGTALSRHVAALAEFGIFAGQRAALGALTISAMGIDPDVRGVAIVTPRGDFLARSGELAPSDWPYLEPIQGRQLGAGLLVFIEPVRLQRLPVDDIYGGVETPAKLAPVIGYVVIELSRSEVSARIARLILLSAAVATLGIGLGGWLAWRIGRSVADPLFAANEVVERIGRGDLEARLKADAAGPLRSLASGINQMAERIGVSQEELRMRVAEATAGLQREKEAAEHATMAKSHFLAAASHDLRQPLHALGLFVSALARSKEARRQPDLVEHIRSATDTLQNLFDAILDISRLDSGNVVPRPQPFSLGPVLERLQHDLAPIAAAKGIKLRIRPTTVWLESDADLVMRILLNLVGNALRYTTRGGVLVSCRRRGKHAVIEVWDTGNGIPASEQDQIFEEYAQLDNPERDPARGLGLGLAICRRLAQLLDARLGLRSRPGRGSVFWLQIPLAEPLPATAAEPAPDPPDDPTQVDGMVLVVDPDPLVRAGMETAIRNWGGAVTLAANRNDALAQCCYGGCQPDVAICNLHLPGGESGIELAAELRRLFPALGVLLVTADSGEDAQRAARDACLPLLKQPLPPGRLRAALRILRTTPH